MRHWWQVDHFLTLICRGISLRTRRCRLLRECHSFLANSHRVVALQLCNRDYLFLHETLAWRGMWGGTTRWVVVCFWEKVLFLSLQNYLLICTSWCCRSWWMQRIKTNWPWLSNHNTRRCDSAILFGRVNCGLHVRGWTLYLLHDLNQILLR